MNALSPFVRDDAIVLDAIAANRDELFALASKLLAARNGIPAAQVRAALDAREALGSTAMGHGIAIPHARMPQLHEPAFAYIRLREPIPFDAHDGKPVSQFLFLLVPKEANEHHLQLMAAAAGALSDRAIRKELGDCSECAQAREALAGWSPD